MLCTYSRRLNLLSNFFFFKQYRFRLTQKKRSDHKSSQLVFTLGQKIQVQNKLSGHNPFFHVSIIMLRGSFCVIIWESTPSLVLHTIVFAMKVKMGKILLYPLLFLCNEMRLFRNKKKGVISTKCQKKKKIPS